MIFRKFLLGAALITSLSSVSLAMDLTMKSYHQKAQLSCVQCHKDSGKFVVPEDKTCMACHGSYKELARKTAKLEEPNPHKSHHYGEYLSCTSCHSEHQKAKVFCNECHEFRYNIQQ